MTHQELNELVLEAHARAKARGTRYLECPVDGCSWPEDKEKAAAKDLRRHLIASH
jgi:hypothetical protein